jgi:hypothetical protein
MCLVPVPSFSSWQYSRPFGQDDPAVANVHYGPEPFARDALDARRMMVGATPEAQYPDGYLGTIRSRRDDRLLNALKERQSQRPYQRGVHKGERVDPRDYFWDPKAMTPTQGLERQAQAVFVDGKFFVQRMAPTGEETVLLAQRDKMVDYNVGRRDVPVANPVHQLAHLKPNWI